METLTQTIKRRARELGFSKVGVARAEKLTEEGRQLCEWLHRGYHATLSWMERNAERRIDPRLILPGARSVVCVACNYYTDAEHSSDPSKGKISRYAWGDDYHEVLLNRLEQLLDVILHVVPEAHGKVYVDTGPVMEKAWAVRAGIGWLGKHTNVITREYGSWVFLGEIILDQPLEYDEPIADLCGTCTACIDACPTHAITEPYVLDSNLCISYLTIEHRESFSPELASHVQNWVYGCDICQDVCPWNRFQKPTDEPAFRPRLENLAPDLTELATISSEEFSRRFQRSPIKRAKVEGLRRNAKVALSNHELIQTDFPSPRS